MTVGANRLRNEEGFGLFITFLLLLILAAMGSASLVQSSIDLKSSAYHRAGNNAFMASEAGMLHALGVMNTTLVWNLQEQLESGSWTTRTWMYGNSWASLPQDPSARYQVVVTPDEANPVDLGFVTATGIAPMESMRTVRVRIRRSGVVASPGAIYLISEQAVSGFQGNAFDINGNDFALNGMGSAGTGITRPGISTQNDAVTGSVVQSLNNQQRDNVQGLGYQPPSSTRLAAPSVLPSSGPNGAEAEELISNILENSSPIYRNNDRVYNGTCANSFGTLNAPQVTHLINSAGTRINGDFCGAGIMIADGPLVIQGSMNFTGWIIARSGLQLSGTGDAIVVGSVWTNGVEFDAGGSLTVRYSTPALELANRSGGNPDGNVPRVLQLLSWEEL